MSNKLLLAASVFAISLSLANAASASCDGPYLAVRGGVTNHSLGDKESYHDGCPPASDFLQAGEPCVVIPAAGLEHRPETVVHVEPKGDETDDVDDGGPHLAERNLNEQSSGCGGNLDSFVNIVAVKDFGKLHLGPELNHVNHQEGEHDDTQHEHVL